MRFEAVPDDPEMRWYEPGVYHVASGIHRIPLPLPDALRAVNVYVIEDGDGLVLVDSGWALDQTRERLSAGLAALGCGLGDVRRFLVTHLHRDHYSEALVLRREFGNRVSLGAGERRSLEVVSDPAAPPFGAQLERLHRAGASIVAERVTAVMADEILDPALWDVPDDWLEDGAEIALTRRTLRAISTPGHTQGHLVYHDDAAGVLFAGDHVLPHITPSISFEPAPGPSPLADFLGSLRRVRALPDARLLPAHGPVVDSAHERVDELLAHHDARLDASAMAVARGAGTAYHVTRELTWTRHELPFDELAPFHQMLAVIETLAHLDLLVDQGRLAAAERDGVRAYSPREE